MPQTTKQDVARFGGILQAVLAQLGQEFQRTQQRREFETAYQNAPREMEDIVGKGGRTQLPTGDIKMQEFLPTLMRMIGVDQNPRALGFLQAKQMAEPKYQAFSPGSDIYAIPPFQQPKKVGSVPNRPSMYGEMGVPTQLAKHQAELEAIRQQNPNDPRIRDYEAVIEKIKIGVPTSTLVPTGSGELKVYDPKKRAFVADTGEYKVAPSEARMAKVNLRDNLLSSKTVLDSFNKVFVGPAEGNIGRAVALFKNSPEFVRFRAQTGRLRSIIYGLSGKQINETELEWLDNEILPKLRNPDENFLAYLEEYKNWVNQKLGLLEQEFPGGSNPTPTPKPTGRGKGF